MSLPQRSSPEPIPPSLEARLKSTFLATGPSAFTGYVVDPSDLERRFAVEILVDGQPVKVVLADLYEDTLAQVGLGDGYYGFRVSLPTTIADDSLIVEARLANIGTSLGDPILLRPTPARPSPETGQAK